MYRFYVIFIKFNITVFKFVFNFHCDREWYYYDIKMQFIV